MLLIGVNRAAAFLQVSERRVRYLLQQGRIDGYKDRRGWRVFVPINIRPGKRGPDLGSFPVRKLHKAQAEGQGK